MTWFGFFTLFGLVFFPCQGVIFPPSSGDSLTFLPGSTGKIEWSFDDNITSVFQRSWAFTSTDGSFKDKTIATVSDDDNPKIRVSFPVIAVEKPATLVLKNVDRRYDGKYGFQVTASARTSFEVTVFIAEKPNVTLNCSSPVPLLKGANFTCLCRGEGGNPPANVTWFKDGEKFTDVGTEMQTLNLLNVSREDNGTYTCNATSYPHKNYTDEESIKVTVYSKPNVSINCSSSITVKEGGNVTCDCKCKDGTPPANCTWYENSTQIGGIGKDMKTLNLYGVTKEDSGIYTCVGKSHVIAQDENSINVTVYYKPVGTTIKFSPFPAVFNQSLSVTCLSSGLPDPNITIFHNDTKVASGMTYNIARVNRTHAGTYKCVANNYLGNDSFSIFLRVNATKPTTPPLAIISSSAIKPSSTISAIPSSSTQSSNGGGNKQGGDGGEDGDSGGLDTGEIVGIVVGGGLAFIALICGLICYCKYKERDNKSVNPNGSKVITNHYELEEDQLEGGGNTYDTAKPPDKGEGSQNNAEQKPPGDSLPPVYASVNKDNRQGNTLYASLDSEALKRPSQKKPAENQPKIAPTEYASIDFMKTAKTPNDDSVST